MPMASSGEVRREDVELVLRAHGVELSHSEEEEGTVTILAKGEVVEAHQIPEFVGRRLLQRFQWKFGIPIHHFYHPLMAPSKNDETIH